MDLPELPDIQALPNFQILYQGLQSLATLEAIICENWEMRYFSFDSKWSDSQAMGSMRDGEGSHYFILFDENRNVMGKIFDSEIGNRTILDVERLAEFDYFLTEPAFVNDEATWYFYRSAKSEQWHIFPQENQISFLQLLTEPMAYVAWAKEYFNFDVDNDTVKKIVDFIPLTEEMVLQLNPNRNLAMLQEDLEEIGYPYEF